jgi:hypothetical protein
MINVMKMSMDLSERAMAHDEKGRKISNLKEADSVE